MNNTEKLKTVDFFFTNSLDELDSVREILETHNIPIKIIRSNNQIPYLGINSTIGIEKKFYNYVIQVPENYIDSAEFFLSEALPENENLTEPEEEASVESQINEIQNYTSLKTGYFFILLFLTHFSRYFSSLKKINHNKKKQIALTFFGLFYFIMYCTTLVFITSQNTGTLFSGIYFSLLGFSFSQALLNLIDFIIERNKLQKYLFILLGLSFTIVLIGQNYLSNLFINLFF